MDTKRNVWLIAIAIIVVVLIWGLIGGAEAQDVGVTCNVGVGDTFCWSWEKNALGEISEAVEDIFDNNN